jgi:hypothetical protein
MELVRSPLSLLENEDVEMMECDLSASNFTLTHFFRKTLMMRPNTLSRWIVRPAGASSARALVRFCGMDVGRHGAYLSSKPALTE